MVGGKDRSSLWIVPFGSGRPRRLTHGAWSDSAPRFSPDGRSLAFLSDREKAGVSQLLVLPLDGGDPKPLTAFRRGVTEAEWMPDGRSLAVVATDDESYDLHGERKGDETATVRVLRHVDWRMDGDGLLDHRRHVHVVTLGGRSRRLTRGPWSAYHVRPHPGGKPIGFIADRGGDEIHPDPQVHVVEVKSGRIRQRSKLPGEVMRFSFDPDGTPICIAFDRNPPMDEDPSLVWRVAGDGSGLLLTEGMESFAGKQGGGDERLTVIPVAGRELPCRVTDDGLVQLVDPALNPTAYELTGAGERVAVLMSLNDYDGADVYALEPGREPRRRTAAGDAWLAEQGAPGDAGADREGPGRTDPHVRAVAGRREEPADADHPAHPRRPHLGVAVCGRRDRPHAGRRRVPGGTAEHPGILGPGTRVDRGAGRGLGRRGRRRLPCRARPPDQGRAG